MEIIKKGRPYRKWLDNIKELCQKDIGLHLLIKNSLFTKQMETGGKMFVGDLQAFCPWIITMMN